MLPAGVRTLQKPFRISELVAVLNESLIGRHFRWRRRSGGSPVAASALALCLVRWQVKSGLRSSLRPGRRSTPKSHRYRSTSPSGLFSTIAYSPGSSFSSTVKRFTPLRRVPRQKRKLVVLVGRNVRDVRAHRLDVPLAVDHLEPQQGKMRVPSVDRAE